MSTRVARIDRDLQDRVIRYLTDADVRSAQTAEFLDDVEAQRARRFSRFLARRYYRDRLNRGFRHSASLLAGGQAAEHIVDSMEFDPILSECVLGSLATSRAVGALAVDKLKSQLDEPWWGELLEYECAFFAQLATSEATPKRDLPAHGVSAVMRQFTFRVPELLERLRVKDVPADDFRGEVTLLFSRTQEGKIYVVEVDEIAAAVWHAVDGRHTAAEIAESTGISAGDRVLGTLRDIGAVVLPDRN